MAFPGPAPKPADQRVNRNPKAAETLKVSNTPYLSGPDLPDRNPEGGQPWTRAARAFWSTLSTMPHCCLWSAMDWELAVQTTSIYERTFAPGNEGLGAHRELRARDKSLGMSLDARRCLRIEYVDEPADLPAGVTDLATRREAID